MKDGSNHPQAIPDIDVVHEDDFELAGNKKHADFQQMEERDTPTEFAITCVRRWAQPLRFQPSITAVQLPKPKTKKVATKPSSASLELRRGTGSSMFCFFVETRLHRRKLKAAATVDGSSAKPRASIDINSILVREHAYLTTVSQKRMSWITAWSICQRLSLWPTREQNRPIRKRVSCI